MKHLLLACVAWPLLSSEAVAASGIRHRCTLPDGSTRLFLQDLGRSFASVGTCEQVRVELPDEAAEATRSSLPEVRTIVLRALEPARTAALPPPPNELVPWIDAISRRHGLNPALTRAVMYVESRYRPEARSPKGALGLMQVMPATASRYGVASADKLRDPQANIEVGVRYLRDLLAMFEGRVDLAVAAYNAGEGAVMKHGYRIPPYTETRAYVDAVLGHLGALPALL